MRLHQVNYTGAQQVTIKELAPLWTRFIGAESSKNADVHVQYCELIQQAISYNQAEEAYRLLMEGFQLV